MTPYLTAQAAATRLGKSEKTIRRWIAEGRLHAHHPNGRKNMLAISEDDIEKLAQEEAQYKKPAEDQDTSSLATQLAQLRQDFENYQALSYPGVTVDFGDIAHVESKLDRLEQRLDALERLLSVGTSTQSAISPLTTSKPRRASATTATFEPLENLPSHSMPYYRFAEMHHVVPRTFRDHIQKHGVEAIERPRQGRKNEKTYWLTPEQQQAALAYWQANNTPYQECLLCPHTDEVYQRAGQDQEVAAIS